MIEKLSELQKEIRSFLGLLKIADEQLTVLIKTISQLKFDEWTPKSLNWSKLTRETLHEIKQGTVQDIVEQLCSKGFVPRNKVRTAYFQVQQTLWAMKSRKEMKKTGSKESAIWEKN